MAMRVRSMFSRLRSGYATELKAYRKRIGLNVSELCIHCDMDAVEDIHHTVDNDTRLGPKLTFSNHMMFIFILQLKEFVVQQKKLDQ